MLSWLCNLHRTFTSVVLKIEFLVVYILRKHTQTLKNGFQYHIIGNNICIAILKPSHTDLYVLREAVKKLMQSEYYFYKKRDIRSKLKVTFKFKAPISICDVFSLEEGKLFPVCPLKSPENNVLRLMTTRLWSLNIVFHQNN